jgi:Trypsin-like peptidase domain
MKKILATLVMGLMLLLSPAPALKAEISNFHQALSAATFALYGQENDIRHFLCTAETYEWDPTNGYKLITAGHCVVGDGLPTDLKFYVAETADPNPVLMPVDVVKAENSDKYDFAILSLKTDRVYPIMHLAPQGRSLSEPESIIVNVNFSEGITKEIILGRVASGIISNKGAEGDCTMCQGRFLANLSDGPGASGSAIVDEGSHEVIGLTEGGFGSLPGITIAIPISLFWQWQNDHKTLPASN